MDELLKEVQKATAVAVAAKIAEATAGLALGAAGAENEELKKEIDLLKENFLLKQKLEETEVKLKAALEKAEEKTQE